MSLEKFFESINKENKELCYPKRISSVKARGRETGHIEIGIAETVQVLEDGVKSFVVYGEPQSGKTEFMIALACKLIDMNYTTIFIVMNDNTELETQNFDRFHEAPELNPTPLRDTQLPHMSDNELKIKKQRIIFCRKNSKNLQKVIEHCRFMDGRIIIDDEADFASPNSKINKKEVTAINKYLGELGKLDEHLQDQGTYIGVTATPARLDLNNTFLNDSNKWIFLNSHSFYKGHKFFFPVSEEDRNTSDYLLKRLPDDTDNPSLLRSAVFRFLCRASLLNFDDASELTAYSMLIHTAGKINDHEKDQKDLQAILGILSNQDSNKFENYVQELMAICKDLIAYYKLPYLDYEVASYIVKNIGKSEVLVINHKNDSDNVRRAGQPKALFTFAIGGNIVSRGLTFDRLLTFFFSRNVKGRLQQNTYIQRARMFGTRPNSNYFELCVPDQLFNDWADCFQNHEVSLRLARAGVYQHVQSGRTSVVDASAIDKENVTVEKSERAVGDIFDLTEEIEMRLLSHDARRPLDCIEALIEEKLLLPTHFPESLIAYLKETSFKDQKDIHMVFRSIGEQKLLQNIEQYKDGNPATITRARGGIVHAMLNKRKEYEENNHFILPIRNETGQARFLYKANLGHYILQNLLTTSS